MIYFKKIYFLLLILFFLSFSSIVLAKKNFKTEISANYVIDNQSHTIVNQTVHLTNLESSVYVSEYAMEIGSAHIGAIVPTLPDGTRLPFSTTNTASSTIIKLTFPNPVVGKDKTLTFNISYHNPDIATLTGKVLEINIPKINNIEDIDSYTTAIIVPAQFGQPTLVTPVNYQIEHTTTATTLSFGHPDAANSVTALFGDKQFISFTLSYHLENPTVNKGVTQIALPPDTSYQQVFYNHIDPRPESVHLDADGNWIATYQLEPKQQTSVVVQGEVILFLKPNNHFPKLQTQLQTYLKPQPFWPVDDPKIKLLADQLKTPQAIYDHIVNTFSYDYTKLESSHSRQGALTALTTPDKVTCQEFTDTFITLARAAKIPARELNGFAYTKNAQLRPLSLVQDVLHSWPEYFDSESKQWIPVDPTWGKTTGGIDYFSRFDLNHFTFVIHGIDSQTPYPAGYYKTTDSYPSKDILIEFTSQPPRTHTLIDFHLNPSLFNYFGLPGNSSLTFINLSNHALYDLNFSLKSQLFTVDNSSYPNLSYLLPFAENSLKIVTTPDKSFYSQPFSVTLQTPDHSYEKTTTFSPNQSEFIFASTLAVASTFIISTIFAWRVLVFIKKQKNSLRR